MNRGRRLRAPRDDRGVLVDPPWSELIALAKSNVVSNEAREEFVRAAFDYTRSYRDVASLLPLSPSPLLLAGHQPELFHPGVWAKNFAMANLAKQTGGVAVNLVIDGDVLKSPSLGVPTGTPAEARVEAVPFDDPDDAMPYEERRIKSRDLFESFGRRAADAVRPFVKEPLIERLWPLALDEARGSDVIGACIARARHRLEAEWGLNTLELPQSRLCETPGFQGFSARLLADLPRFHEAHNGALADYRRAEGIRSAGRPVPPLVREGAWYEAPLWIWTADQSRRRRVFVCRTGREIELTDRERLTVRMSGSELPHDRNIKFRSRALLTTMYARHALGGTFIHGIGGGKYDELTDEIIRRYFGVEPPPFAVVTATRHLPVPSPSPGGDDEAALVRRLRELTYHPERFVDAVSADAIRLVAEKRQLIAEAPSRATTKAWCQAVRRVNGAFEPHMAAPRREIEVRLAAARRDSQAGAILTSREISSFLFPEKDLRDFLLVIGRGRR